MKNENRTLLLLSLLSAFMLTACGGDIPGLSTSDTDSDGLTDADEINLYHTNPDVADTDGDGYSDFEEIINKNFDPSNSNYRFNPLIADVPKLNVSFGVPNFSLTYSTSTSTGNTFETGYQQTVSTDTISTYGGESSHSIARNFSTEVSTEATVSFTPEVKVGLKLTSGFTDTDSNGTNWSNTTQQSNGESYSTLQAFSNDITNNVDSASMALFVSVENPGHVAYTLNDLSLSVTMAGDNASGYGIPIGTLLRAPNSTATIPLAVGGAATSEVYTLDMSLENYKTLINNYSNLVITPNVGDNNLGSDNNETNWVNLSDDVAIRTATISIDYGQAGLPETYRVATALDINSQSLTLAQILTDILKLPYTVQNESLIPTGDTVAVVSSRLASIRGIAANALTKKLWFVAHEHTTASGVGTETDIYTPSIIQDFENLIIKAGDGVRMVYIQDTDSDNLSDREEYILGTDVSVADTDGDGINDGDEVNGYSVLTSVYTSNPTLADSDGDGLTDSEERTYLTDPRNSDTDGDSASDYFEVMTGGTDPTADDSATYAADSDGDLLTDIEETFITLTDPGLADTDGDGLSDSEELGRVSATFSAQMPVVDHCVSKYNAAIVALNDPAYDIYKLSPTSASRCDPNNADTDGDGINDGDEIAGWALGYPVGSSLLIPSNPFVADTDNDGLTDDQEKLNSGNALAKDTDADGLEDGAEITSVHNRSVTIPEVIAVASISKITANQCFGYYSGLFGFSEDQVAFDPNLMPFSRYTANVGYYARIDYTLGASSLWSNLLLRLQTPTEGNPSNWTVNADRGFTNGVDSNGAFQGGTGVEFVNDGGYSYEPLAVGPIYNSEWFSMATDELDSTYDTPDEMHDIILMLKEQVYHPQRVKIAEGQTLKAWSGHFCKTPRVNYNHLQTGGVWERNAANPQDCVAYWASPVNALQKRWSYEKLKTVLTTFDLEETTTLKAGVDPGCSLKVTYDITTIQE